MIDLVIEQHARMAECAIITGEPAKAHAAIDRAFGAMAEAESYQLADDDGIDMIASQRVTTILENAGVRTIGDLCRLTLDEVAGIRQSGPTIARKLQETLASQGLHLRTSAKGVAA
jgi:DNA-directed RNA polymerase alpha subunit